MHDELIADCRLKQTAGAVFAQWKPAKEISLLIVANFLFVLFIHIRRHGIINIKKRRRHLRHTSWVFTQGAVNINLASHGNPAAGQPGVDITGDKAEIGFKSRPAFIGENAVFFGTEVFFS